MSGRCEASFTHREGGGHCDQVADEMGGDLRTAGDDEVIQSRLAGDVLRDGSAGPDGCECGEINISVGYLN